MTPKTDISLRPPMALTHPHIHEKHGIKREDPYFWLNKRENPQVIQYLNDENAYADSFFNQNKKLSDNLYNEILSRINEDDQSVPVKDKDYLFYTKTFKGKQYPAYYRKSLLTQKEELLIDVNQVAPEGKYTSIPWPKISPNEKIMAYGWDQVGRRIYNIHFKSLDTQKKLDTVIENTTGNFAWANDNVHLFYSQQDVQTLRSNKIFRFNINTKVNELIYEEKDETYRVFVSKSLSEKFIYITSTSTESSEVRYLDANTPQGQYTIFFPREKNHLYHIADDREKFYILSNWQADNFRLFTSPAKATDKKYWHEVIPHNKEAYLNDISVFANHVVVSAQKKGLNEIEIYKKDFSQPYSVPFVDEAYSAEIGSNLEFDTKILRFTYESKVQPLQTIDIDMNNFKQNIIDQKFIPNYDAKKYKTKRIWVKSRDGQRIPVTLLMKADHTQDSTAPLLVYGYGSYGATIPIYFSSTIFPLIDRGFVYAFAHIRGGADLGRQWYYEGRQLKKMNTFNDFIDVTDSLIKDKYADSRKVFAMGGSAGGLLMGAVVNMRPELYRGIVAQVPFVDVVTTMLDDSIPLTTSEYDEWGNPNEKLFFEYMLQYSPYDNVQNKKYPNMLITTGLHDSQVQYWEPAKWVARLRTKNQSDSLILFKTNMVAGHGGASGRYARYKEVAEEYTFLVEMLNDKYEYRK